VLAGQCTTPLTNIRQISPAWSIPTTGVTSYDYNPDKAKQLLAEAGWDPNTKLILLTRTGRSYVDKAMTILQGQLAAVGVNVTLQNVDTGQLLDTWKKQDDSWQAAWNSGADFTIDPIAMQTYALCSARYPAGGNTSQYCNTDVDALFAKGVTQTNQDERATTYKDVFTRLQQDPSEIYLYVVNSISAFNKKITGIKAHGNLSQPYWNIEEWTWQG
jgi:peptide/nickel transport system substrate-binding protein